MHWIWNPQHALASQATRLQRLGPIPRLTHQASRQQHPSKHNCGLPSSQVPRVPSQSSSHPHRLTNCFACVFSLFVVIAAVQPSAQVIGQLLCVVLLFVANPPHSVWRFCRARVLVRSPLPHQRMQELLRDLASDDTIEPRAHDVVFTPGRQTKTTI